MHMSGSLPCAASSVGTMIVAMLAPLLRRMMARLDRDEPVHAFMLGRASQGVIQRKHSFDRRLCLLAKSAAWMILLRGGRQKRDPCVNETFDEEGNQA